MNKDVKKLKRQIAVTERKLNQLTAKLEEIEEKRIESKEAFAKQVIKKWAIKNNVYYENNLVIFNTFSNNNIYLECNLNIDIEDGYMYIGFNEKVLKNWESSPKVFGDDFAIKLIDYNIPKEYLKNTIIKTLNRTLQWHNSRPLHPEYKKSGIGIL